MISVSFSFAPTSPVTVAVYYLPYSAYWRLNVVLLLYRFLAIALNIYVLLHRTLHCQHHYTPLHPDLLRLRLTSPLNNDKTAVIHSPFNIAFDNTTLLVHPTLMLLLSLLCLQHTLDTRTLAPSTDKLVTRSIM